MAHDPPRSSFGRSALAWGLIDQGLSSFTNLALTVVVGRELGAEALGLVSIGFAAYVVTLVLYRGLVPEALIISTGGAEASDQDPIRSGITLTLVVGVLIGASMAALGAVGGHAFSGLLLFAPWIVPSLLQPFWRYLLFARGRRRGAALNDGIWLVVMLALFVPAWTVGEAWAFVAAWGIGALFAAVAGFIQTRTFPDRNVVRSFQTWRREAAALGGWLAAETGFRAIGVQGSLFLLASFVPPSAIGGLRAVQTVFTPLTLVAPAINLPGLPAMISAVRRSAEEATSLARRLSFLTIAMTAAYVGLLMLGPDRVIQLVFGHDFGRFAPVALPVAVEQLAIAAAAGQALLLKAASRGKPLAVARGLGTACSLVLATWLAANQGIVWAAWGLASGVMLSTVLIVLGARRAARPTAEERTVRNTTSV
jgi:O-antigen/teichoic acid export membrane protein